MNLNEMNKKVKSIKCEMIRVIFYEKVNDILLINDIIEINRKHILTPKRGEISKHGYEFLIKPRMISDDVDLVEFIPVK